ncbi:hypothetical protein JOF29_002346 [Kribbella aluminosa]|uniref:Uncharacterized protein n=1 Tax=Kribbella aluminosa TaxID=416017 RepID=A0ABS4UHY2_9ACTN|nr:hypothetical protein [Kribbella aluminosa]MBP2351263.1 hypothetical protein [Kribbella aluminosa]
MDYEQFEREYVAAWEGLQAGRLTDLAAAQTRLSESAAKLEREIERRSAERLIGELEDAVQPPPPDQSPEMTEALRMLMTADFKTGAKEERLAALAAARRQIWAIADRAGKDSEKIRGLSRGLETSENMLTDPMPWDEPPPPAGA